MNHRPFILLDIETTGGSARYARITEIGALRIENGEVVATFNQLINPETKIPYFITKLTGITDEMVWEAPTFQGIVHDFELFIDGAIFVAHNVNFDYSFIKMEFERLRMPFQMDRLCSAKLSKKLYPEFKSHALDRVIERLGINVDNRHRAFDDAEVIWKFISKELEQDAMKLFRNVDKLVIKSRS